MMRKRSVVDGRILPEEMVEEILVRIPVRWLVDLRCVCKSWDALISDPQFASKHLDRNNNDQNILFLGFRRCYVRKIVSLFRLNQQPTILFDIHSRAGRKLDFWQISETAFWQKFNFSDCFKEVFVAGSINGIICLSSFFKSRSRFVALWNPAINHWKPIPLAPPKKGDNLVNTSIGLAFDSITSDYKVIRLVCVRGLSPHRFRIEIYSANQDSWIEVNQGSPIPYFTTQPNCSVIVKGVPYWSKNFIKDEFSRLCQTDVVAAVDPHTGLYNEIPYPQIPTNENTSAHPFNFMDSLALLIYSPGETSNQMFHVYALDETSATWIQIFTTTAPTILQNKLICILRCFVHAGKTIVVGWDDEHRCSFLYDLETDCLCDSIGMDGFRPRWDECYHHVESLVCLHGMEPIRKEEEEDNNSKRGHPMYLGRALGPVL